MQKRESLKRTFVWAIMIGLVILPVISIGYLLIPDSAQKAQFLSGFDILHDCTADLTVLLGLIPSENTRDVKVAVSINDWEKIKDTCNSVNIYFPGYTYNQQFLPNLGSIENIGAIPAEGMGIPISNEAEIIHDPSLYQDIIRIKPKESKNFSGTVEFHWLNGLNKTGFGTFSLLLPFHAIIGDNERTLTGTKAFEVSLVSPSGYDLTSAAPGPSTFKPFADIAFYYFNLEAGNTALSITFSNSSLEHSKDLLLILFSALLGVGLTLVFERMLARLDNKKTAFPQQVLHSDEAQSRKNPLTVSIPKPTKQRRRKKNAKR
jgi:hypothetical protein